MATTDRTFEFRPRTLNALPLPPDGEQWDYYDSKEKGLGLRVSYGGRRAWFLRYRVNGQRKRLGLGEYPDMGIAEARTQARIRRGEVAGGGDPAGEKAKAQRAPTVRQLADAYIEDHAKAHKRSWQRDEAILARDVLPAIGAMKAAEVSRADVRDILKKITKRGAPIAANRCHEVIRKLFNFAIDELEWVEHNPALRLARNKEGRRERSLTADELERLWKALDAHVAAVPVLHKRHRAAAFRAAAALKLLLLTAQREANVLQMRWPDLDLREAWWTIPPEMTKSGRTYRVPLSGPALGIIEQLQVVKAHDTWVFPSRKGEGAAIRSFISKPWGGILQAAAVEDLHPHDLRHTAASHMTGMGILQFIVAKVLHHADKGITAAYDHHDYAREKRRALDSWAARVMAIVEGEPKASNVVQLGTGQAT